MLKVTIRFTDKDHPYSYNDEDVLFVETVEEAEKICKERSWRREYWTVVKVEAVVK